MMYRHRSHTENNIFVHFKVKQCVINRYINNNELVYGSKEQFSLKYCCLFN